MAEGIKKFYCFAVRNENSLPVAPWQPFFVSVDNERNRKVVKFVRNFIGWIFIVKTSSNSPKAIIIYPSVGTG